MTKFQTELSSLINKHSIENDSDTPDFLLAKFLTGCLNAYTATVNRRDKWYGDKHWEGFGKTTTNAPGDA